MAQAVIAHIAPCPTDVGFFGLKAEMFGAAGAAHLVKQFHGPGVAFSLETGRF